MSSSWGDYSVAVTDQNKDISSMSLATLCVRTPETKSTVHLNLSLPVRLVERTPPQCPPHNHSLLFPYKEGSQVYDYNQGTLRSLLSQELVMDSLGMQTSLGLLPSNQICCLTQSTEFHKSCTSRNQIYESNPPRKLGDSATEVPVQHNPSLTPAPAQEQPVKKNVDEIKVDHSESLDAYQNPIVNQDTLLCPIENPKTPQFQAFIDSLSQEQQPGFDNNGLGKKNLCFEDQETLKSGIELNNIFTDITTWVEDEHLPPLFESLIDIDQPNYPQAINTTDTIPLNQAHKTSSHRRFPSNKMKKNKKKALDPVEGEPQDKIKLNIPVRFLGKEVIIVNAVANERAHVNMAKLNHTPQKIRSNRSKSQNHRQEKMRRVRENNNKKADESRQPGTKVEAEGKSVIPHTHTKRKTNPTELSQEPFKKPRSCLGTQMLESVQVSHVLGKKSDQTPGLSSSRTLGNSKKPKDFQPSSAHKPRPDAIGKGKSLERTPIKTQKSSSSAEEKCPSLSLYDLPPPGKIKLIPLPFLNLDKHPARPVSQRRQSLAAHCPAAAHPAQIGSTTSSQGNSLFSSRKTPASLTGLARRARPIKDNSAQPDWKQPPSRPIPHSASSRPAPTKTSACTFLQRKPGSTSVTKCQSTANAQNQFLLQDFSVQPIRWRKPNVPGPVISMPAPKSRDQSMRP
ncbi:uncharacterized protein C2orf78-like [Suncus etruscus]|uniref:uncharacterized protein C2orf78-like n=1 Tax=Suncus etruscus TaxID=109475 RepID=UPI00210FD49A|nr:uncharacterized protein C2orf78-like [Suncus etruscus]